MKKIICLMTLTLGCGFQGCKPRTFNNDASTEDFITKDETRPDLHDQDFYITNNGTQFTRTVCYRKPVTKENCDGDPISAPAAVVLEQFRAEAKVLFSAKNYWDGIQNEIKDLSESLVPYYKELESLKESLKQNENDPIIAGRINAHKVFSSYRVGRLENLKRLLENAPEISIENVIVQASKPGIVDFRDDRYNSHEIQLAALLLARVIAYNSPAPIPQNLTLGNLMRQDIFMQLRPKKTSFEKSNMITETKFLNIESLTQTFSGNFCSGVFGAGNKPIPVYMSPYRNDFSLQGEGLGSTGISCGNKIHVYDTFQDQRFVVNQHGSVRTIAVTNYLGELVRYGKFDNQIVEYVVRRVNTGTEYNYVVKNSAMPLTDLIKTLRLAYTVEVSRKPFFSGQTSFGGQTRLIYEKNDK